MIVLNAWVFPMVVLSFVLTYAINRDGWAVFHQFWGAMMVFIVAFIFNEAP